MNSKLINRFLTLVIVALLVGVGMWVVESRKTLYNDALACCYEAECGTCADTSAGECGGSFSCWRACCIPDDDPRLGGGGGGSPLPPNWPTVAPGVPAAEFCGCIGCDRDEGSAPGSGSCNRTAGCGSLTCDTNGDGIGDANEWWCKYPSMADCGGCSPGCNILCGQDDGCGGTCASTDVGTPGAVTQVSPLGTAGNPAIVQIPDDGYDSAAPGSLVFTWLNNEVNHAYTDYYELEMYTSAGTVLEVGYDDPTVTTDYNSDNHAMGDYYWRMRASNNTCGNTPTGVLDGPWSSNQYFRLDHFPAGDNISFNGTSCAGGNCNGDDIIVDYDANDRNRQVPVTVTFHDWDNPTAGRMSDIQNAYVVFHTNNLAGIVTDLGIEFPLRVSYTDWGNGTWSLAAAGHSGMTIVNPVTTSASATVGTSSRSYNATTHVLTVNFTLDLSPMTDCYSDFGANVYLYANDFYSQTAGVTRAVGTGAFGVQTDANAANSLDFWAGRYVCVTGVLQSLGDVSVPSTYSVNATVGGSCTLTSPLAVTAPGSAVRLPYRHHNGTNTCTMTLTGDTAGFYLRGTNLTNFGGLNTTIASGSDTNYAVNGGWRQSVLDATLKYENSAPTTGVLRINGTDCATGNCDGTNIVTDFDPAYPTHTLQQIPFSISFTDGDNPPDAPDQLYFANQSKIDMYVGQTANFNTNNDPTGAYSFGVHYRDNGNGNWSMYTSGSMAQNLPGTPNGLAIVDPVTNSAVNTVGTSSRTRVGDVVTVNFVLDVSDMAGNQPFLGNIYVGAVDIGGGVFLANSSVPGVGAGSGNFNPGDTVGPVNDAVDFWNGRDIYVTGNMYQVTSADDLCNNGARLTTGPDAVIPLGANIPLTVSYTPNNLGGWPISINNWIGQNIYQPYYYYNYAGNGNQGYTITYQPTVTTSDYFLVSMDLIRYGGTCSTTVTGGQIQGMRYNRGGFRPDDSSHVDAAFGAKQISQVWSRSVDGDYFANSNVTTTVETSTCTGVNCYFTVAQVAPQNGMGISNGAFGAEINNRFGSPNNWHAEAGGAPSKMPFMSYTLPSYGALISEFGGSGYTELTGNQTLSGVNPQANRVYFIDGDFTVDQNFTVALNNFVVFVVSGNITVEADVTAMEGIYIAPAGSLTIVDNATPNYDVTNISDRLTIQGAVVIGEMTFINRTMGAGNNGEAPVVFQARPDMAQLLKSSNNPLSTGVLYYLGEF